MPEPRILAIMGSGETGTAMARVHRDLLRRLPDPAATATVIDTPYGFQENADDITAKIVEYFAATLGQRMTVTSYRSRDVDAVTAATAQARIREASYVLSGPGSPSYALRQWAGGPIPDELAARLARGGIVTMASAAALTLGVVTIPVYEIYKVGADPYWMDGLDLLGAATGLRAAVVPHYDNAEGGTHDTRFCFVGERRLQVLERLLPEDTFILGVDSHTAIVLDLQAGRATVHGLGGVTVRAAGRSRFFPAGSDVPTEDLAEAARSLSAAGGPDAHPTIPSARAVPGPGPAPADDAATFEAPYVTALALGDIRAALSALLAFDAALADRARAGGDAAELEARRGLYRSLIVRLGEAATHGTRDPRDAIAPLVDALLELRRRARETHDWRMADLIRDRLNEAGVEVRDAADGSDWVLQETAARHG